MRRTITALMLVCGLATGAGADVNVTVTPLVMAGDDYGDGRLVATGNAASENLAINNSGNWLIECRLAVGTPTFPVLLRGSGTTLPGVQVMYAGDPIANPPGATLSSFDSVTLNNSGNSSFNIFYDNATTSTDSGVHFNTAQIIRESQFATAAGFSPMTPYIGWFETYINDSDQILMVASVDDPAIATTVDRAIVRVDDPAGAATQTVLLKEGDEVVPGRLLVDVVTGPHNTAFAGSRVLLIPDLDGATTDDSGLLMHDGTGWSFVAREGDPCPAVSGRNWASLASAAVDMNTGGDWAARATLNAPTSDDSIIVKNGNVVVAREGSGHPSIGSFTFTGFGTGAVRIDDGGNVYYWGDWNDPDTTRDTGLFRNGQLILQENVSVTTTGEVVTDISSVQDNIAISRNGRYLLVEATVLNTSTSASRRGTLLLRLNCPADFNGNGEVTVQDIFDFLAAYFVGDASADFNGAGGVTVQDIFDYLAAYFTPCG